MRDFKKLFGFILPYWPKALLNIILNIFGSFASLFTFSLAIPFLGILFKTQELVMNPVPLSFSFDSIQHNFYYFLSNIIITNGETKALLVLCFLFIGAALLRNLFLYMASFFMAPVINGVVRDIQNLLYKKILSLPLSYYSDDRKGNILARLTNDVQEIRVSSMSTLDIIFRDPLTIMIYLVSMFMISPGFTSFVLLLLPISGIMIGYIGKQLKGQARKGKERYGDLLSEIEETLSGLKIIKAFNSEKRIYRRFINNNNKYTKVMNKLTRLNSLGSPLSEFLSVIVVVLMMYYGGTLILNHGSNLAPQDLIGLLIIFSQVINPVKNLANSYSNIQRGMASIDRVNVILDADDKISEKVEPVDIKEFKQKIEFHDVSFSYGNDNVLSNINLTIEKGKTIAVVGQSGSGKSTLVDLIPRFHDVNTGDLTIDGVSVRDARISDLRNLIGYVNQEAILFNDTFFNNIAFARPDATYEEVVEAAKVANAHDFISETPDGYYTTIGDRGSKLSGGQRQRISIARAVLKNPPILILDEATSALDTESEKLVQDAIIHLMKNRTSIVIAHRLSTIKHAHEIVVIDKGRIAERGSHDELINCNDGIYRKLHELQMF